MDCPACRRAMSARSFGSAEVDVCVGCGGLWLDWGELAKFDEPGEGFGAALEAALAREAGPRRTAPLRCTKCDAAMREHRYQKVPGVLIDECYGCAGFFLDAGELAAIREALGERARKADRADALLARDFAYQMERKAMDVERERTRVLEAVSKSMTSAPSASYSRAIRILWPLLARMLLGSPRD